MSRILSRILICLALLSLGFASSAAAQDQARGMKVYTDQKCSVCHAIAGKGTKGALVDLKLRPRRSTSGSSIRPA
jgi:mono/diheme cytochrome c family protein